MIDGGDELFFVTTIAAEDELRALLSPESAEPQSADAQSAYSQTSDPRTAEPEASGSTEDDGFDG